MRNASSSSFEPKCAAWAEGMCSTRPANRPGPLPERNCTTKARCADSGGSSSMVARSRACPLGLALCVAPATPKAYAPLRQGAVNRAWNFRGFCVTLGPQEGLRSHEEVRWCTNATSPFLPFGWTWRTSDFGAGRSFWPCGRRRFCSCAIGPSIRSGCLPKRNC